MTRQRNTSWIQVRILSASVPTGFTSLHRIGTTARGLAFAYPLSDRADRPRMLALQLHAKRSSEPIKAAAMKWKECLDLGNASIPWI